MQGEPRRYQWTTEVGWTGEHKGTLTAADKPPVGVACPPEFGGHPHIWTPEDLQTAAVNVCMMTTFLNLAERHQLGLVSYHSICTALLTRTDFGFAFASFDLHPRIVVRTPEDASRCHQLLERSKQLCPVSLSLRSQILLQPEIIVESESKA